MRTIELAVIGAGPAGLSAANQAASFGIETMLIDEYVQPGGQLIKQTHKFFGSQEHRAGLRGIKIAKEFCNSLECMNIEKLMGATVWGVFNSKILSVCQAAKTTQIRAEKMIIATGAAENALYFPGWTLPGVVTAGAAQTFMNLHRILLGKRILIVGAGNVGCIVAYQLLQAGADSITIVDAKSLISAYDVHAQKIKRMGVRILPSHTIVRALGQDHVEKAIVKRVDSSFTPIDGTDIALNVDLICIACGLNPLAELARLAECKFTWSGVLGGFVPLANHKRETTVEGIYVAGDCAGIEEASTAIEEGEIAAISVGESLGYIFSARASKRRAESYQRLSELRSGPFGEERAIAKELIHKEYRKYEDEKRRL